MEISKNPKTRAKERAQQLAQAPAVQLIGSTADIGIQVRAHRKKQSLRIDDAAALNGVSVDLLSRLENGSGSIRTDKLLAVINGLGLALVLAPKGHPYLQNLPAEKLLAGSDVP